MTHLAFTDICYHADSHILFGCHGICFGLGLPACLGFL